MANEDIAIAQQLRWHILPFVITAERLGHYPPFLFFSIYSYLRAFLTAVVGAGLSAPLLNFVAGIFNEHASDTREAAKAVAKIPSQLTWAGISIALILIALQVYFSKEDVEKRWIMAQSCRKEFRKLNTRLVNVLNTSADVEAQIQSIRNEVATIYQRHTAEDSWPYSITEPHIEPLVEERLQFLLGQLHSNPNHGVGEIEQHI